MTKVILVISKFIPEYTGAAYRIGLLYKRLQEREPLINIEVLCNSTAYLDSAEYQHEGIKVTRCVFPFRISWIPSRLRNAIKVYYEFLLIRHCLKKKRPNVLHVTGYSGGTMAALLHARKEKIPRLIELVTKEATPAQFLPGLRYKNKLQLEHQTAIIAISQSLAQNCNKLGLSTNIWCRPNPIDEKKFFIDTKARMPLRTKLTPFSDTDIVICMIAKFMPQKNQIFLLEVLKKLPKNFKLLLAGPKVESGIFKKRDQEYFSRLQQAVRDLNLEERVHIHADFVNADDYMKASDTYVMPQYNEGLGTPMLEAIACGLPVIANKDEPAFHDWIEEGVNGYLISPESAKWAKAIEKAQHIDEDTRKTSSKKILSVANTALIDAQYLKIINELTTMPSDEILNIEETLK